MKIALQIVLILFAVIHFFGVAFNMNEQNRCLYIVGARLLVAANIVILCLF